MKKLPQQDMIKELYRALNGDRDAVIAAYAKAERDGRIGREGNVNNISPEIYAARLFSYVKFKGGFR
jgi:hypothetical protein